MCSLSWLEFMKIELGAFLIGALVLRISEDVHMGFHQVLRTMDHVAKLKEKKKRLFLVEDLWHS